MVMKKGSYITLSLSFIVFFFRVSSQEAMDLSLEQAIGYGLEHNYVIRNSTTDVDISRKQVASVTAIGLPQINATVDYSNFIELPTSLIPGEFFGEEPGTFIPIQFGTKHNLSAEASLSQLIFNGSYIIGLQAARSVVEVSQLKLERDQANLKETITNAYCSALVVHESLDIIDSLLFTLRRMLFEVGKTYENGFIEDTDVSQIELLVSDLEATRLKVSQQVEVVTNYLKFQIGVAAGQIIHLTDDLEKLLLDVDDPALISNGFDYLQHVDYRLIQGQETLKSFNLKNKQAQYLPSMN
jgi:outer membrane protein TolC